MAAVSTQSTVDLKIAIEHCLIRTESFEKKIHRVLPDLGDMIRRNIRFIWKVTVPRDARPGARISDIAQKVISEVVVALRIAKVSMGVDDGGF